MINSTTLFIGSQFVSVKIRLLRSSMLLEANVNMQVSLNFNLIKSAAVKFSNLI